MTKTLTTPRGAVLEIELTKLDDMRLFDALVALQDGDPLQMPRIMNLILTPEQKAAAVEYLNEVHKPTGVKETLN